MDRKALLGKRIQEMRKRTGLSQDALAEAAGISTQYVSNIERGKENPTLDLLFSLADSLKLGLAEMLDYEPVDKMDPNGMRKAVREILKTTNPDELRKTLRVLKAIRE